MDPSKLTTDKKKQQFNQGHTVHKHTPAYWGVIQLLFFSPGFSVNEMLMYVDWDIERYKDSILNVGDFWLLKL